MMKTEVTDDVMRIRCLEVTLNRPRHEADASGTSWIYIDDDGDDDGQNDRATGQDSRATCQDGRVT
jgi:hypothetical protein